MTPHMVPLTGSTQTVGGVSVSCWDNMLPCRGILQPPVISSTSPRGKVCAQATDGAQRANACLTCAPTGGFRQKEPPPGNGIPRGSSEDPASDRGGTPAAPASPSPAAEAAAQSGALSVSPQTIIHGPGLRRAPAAPSPAGGCILISTLPKTSLERAVASHGVSAAHRSE